MTMACEMRCPWYWRNERAQRVYLVLSRVVCLAATRESCRRKRAGCGLSPPKTSAMSAMTFLPRASINLVHLVSRGMRYVVSRIPKGR